MAAYHPDEDKNAILSEIDRIFKEKLDEYGLPPNRSLNDITLDMCLSDLDRYGIFLVGDAYSEEVYKYNLEQLCLELYSIIFDIKISSVEDMTLIKYTQEYNRISKKYKNIFKHDNEFRLASLCSFWNSSHGFGNCSFRFIYMQYLNSNYTYNIDGIETPIEFNYNPIHKLNLRLLSNFPRLWELFKEMYGDERPFISFDSQKVRFHDSGIINKIGKSKTSTATRPVMTKRHVDIYDKRLKRKQAMLIMQDEKAVSLGYVLFSNDKKIIKMIKDYLGKEVEHFGVIEDPYLNPILDKYWRAPKQGFVMWDENTIHYEGVPCNESIIRGLKSIKDNVSNLRLFSFRAVIGPHIPYNLTNKALRQLCFLSEHNLSPEIYKNKFANKETAIDYNTVNAKSTQYMVARDRLRIERDILKHIDDNKLYDDINTFISTLPDIIKEMYGIYE